MNGLMMRALPAALLVALSGTALAGGFAVGTQNASGLGNSYAGAAAAAEDASTIFYNPAGLSAVKGRQLAVGGNAVSISSKFRNGASVAAATQALGSDGGDAGGLTAIPFGYAAMEVSPAMTIGIGVGAPFGNATEWSKDWIGRFQGTRSELHTININPTVAYKVSDQLSVGFGINYQIGEAEFLQNVNGVAVAPVFAGQQAEAKFAVDDNEWGWNAGLMWQATPATRLGVAYRSKVKYKMTGDVSYSAANAASVALGAALAGARNAPVTVDLTMPDSFSLALAHKLDSKWEVLGDLTWTGWSVFQKLMPVSANTGAVVTNVPYQWKDVWHLGIGANYKYNDKTKVRVGFAYDESPANDTYRTVTLPDSDRYWLSVGMKYQLSKAGALDVGYAHEFIKDASINNNYGGPTGGASTAAFGLANGTAKKYIDIVGVQYTHNF